MIKKITFMLWKMIKVQVRELIQTEIILAGNKYKI